MFIEISFRRYCPLKGAKLPIMGQNYYLNGKVKHCQKRKETNIELLFEGQSKALPEWQRY